MLSRTVSGHVGHRNVSSDAGDVHDRAASLRSHRGNHDLHRRHGSEQIGIEHAPTFIHIHSLHGIHKSETCVVHPNVNPTESANADGQQALDVFTTPHIARDA